MNHEFYVNADSGYYAWHCYDCDEFIRWIEAGDYLGSHTIDCEFHECDLTTPAVTSAEKTVAES